MSDKKSIVVKINELIDQAKYKILDKQQIMSTDNLSNSFAGFSRSTVSIDVVQMELEMLHLQILKALHDYVL